MTLAYTPETHIAPPAIADIMERLGVRMTFAKGEEIFGQEEAADMIYFVASGAVRTTRFLTDGRRQIGDFYYPGDLIGLETGPVHRLCAEALTDCIVRVVKRSSLRALSGDGDLDRAIWEATRRELERTQEHLMVLGRKTACEKVASFLMDLAQRHDAEEVAVPMGRQDIGDFLGLSIATVSRLLNRLAREGLILIVPRGVRILDLPRLQRLARI